MDFTIFSLKNDWKHKINGIQSCLMCLTRHIAMTVSSPWNTWRRHFYLQFIRCCCKNVNNTFSTWSPSHNYKYPNFSKKLNVWSSHWRWLTKLEILCKREPFFNFTTNRNKSQYCEPLTGCTWTQQIKTSVGLGNLRWFRTLSGRLSESQVRAYPKRFMGLWLIWL